jgi:hypothetical protein
VVLAVGLHSAMSPETAQTLRNAARMARRLATRALADGDLERASYHEERAALAEHQAAVLEQGDDTVSLSDT